MLDEQDTEHIFYLLFPHAMFHLFHLYALFLFLLPSWFPIPRITLQVSVSCRAEGVTHRTLGVPLPDRRTEIPALGLPFLGLFRVLAVNPSGQRQRLAALPPFRKQQLHLGIAAIFPPMFGLAILKARRTVRMDAAV